jgi:GDP-4-dehydro-6-deoxy-D-mannose reductase
MKKTLLITGHDGFVGRSLLDWLPGSAWADRVTPALPPPGFDLRNPEAVAALVTATRPDWVLHLAAQSHVPTSFADPVGTLEVNLIGTTRLLQALGAQGFAGRFLYVSSADLYGAVDPALLPVTEATPLQPANPYAVSKAAAEMMCRQWQRAHGLSVLIARPFNHVGAGQRPEFALSGFAQTIAGIRLGLRPPRIPVGRLDVTRDFTHVLDICEGYLALLDRGVAGQTYNLCSGRERSLADLLQRLLTLADGQAAIEPDPARLRPVDLARMVGDAALAARDTGWAPVRELDSALLDMIDYWKAALQK